MPELPEVETVRRGLAPRLEGRRLRRVVQRRPDLRWPLPEKFADRLTGRRVLEVGRRAKYLQILLDGGEVLLVHLGMSGRMVLSPAPVGDPEPHDHVILETEDGQAVRFNDPRRFGMMDLVPVDQMDRHRLLATLGPEPLGDAFTPEHLADALAGRRTPIKSALLDQRIVAGLGNIYVCEALFQARLSPRRLAANVQAAQTVHLVAAVRDVLTRAIAAGGSSIRDYVQADGELGYFQHAWAVYGREGERCPGCRCGGGDSAIQRIVQSGRSTFYCPTRQR